jgi:hypothetical protein
MMGACALIKVCCRMQRVCICKGGCAWSCLPSHPPPLSPTCCPPLQALRQAVTENSGG